MQGRPLSAGRGLLRRRGGGGLASAAAIVRWRATYDGLLLQGRKGGFLKWRGGGVRRWGGDGSGRNDQSEPIAGRKRTGADLGFFLHKQKIRRGLVGV